MKFTIGTVSNFQQYENALNLIKSSLLYADEIELIGLTEYAVFKYLPTLLDSEKTLDELIDGMIPFLRSVNFPDMETTLQQLEAAQSKLQLLTPLLKKRKHRSTKEIQAQIQMNLLKKGLMEQLNPAMQKLTDEPTSKELQKLIDSKTINIFDYQLQGISTNEMTGSYVASLLNTVFARNNFPLFDDKSTGLIAHIAKAQLIDISKTDADVIRHAGVASTILRTLPTLEAAPYDEIIDFKKQNTVYLSRFRTAIYGFSEKISSLPWDHEFQYECLKLYEAEVLPQVNEINEIFTENSTLKNFGKKVFADEEIRKKASWAMGGLAVAITTPSSLSAVFRSMLVAMSLATFSKEASQAFLKLINMGVEAHNEADKARKQGKENVMYYYYLARKL